MLMVAFEVVAASFILASLCCDETKLSGRAYQRLNGRLSMRSHVMNFACCGLAGT